MDAGRCLNCLSTGHVVRDCSFCSKCRKCGPNVKLKHASVLHNFYAKSNSVNFGAAEAGNTPGAFPAADREGENDLLEESRVLTRKVVPGSSAILLRTRAVKVVNPRTGKATHAYAQHDTASQATLISESLKNELGLGTDHNRNVTIRTLAKQSTPSYGVSNFKLESLSTGEQFEIENALVVPDFIDDINTLPHSVNTTGLDHFYGVEIPTIPHRKTIDILIGQSDKMLLTVLEEREGKKPDDPNYVLTRLGPIGSGGRQVESELNLCQNRRAKVGGDFDVGKLDSITGVECIG